MNPLETDGRREQERRKLLFINICRQHETILNGISEVKFCFKKVIDKRDSLDGHLTKISSMNAVPYLAVLGPNVTQQDEEAIRLQQIVVTDTSLPWIMDCLLIKSPLTTFGKIVIRKELDYENTAAWLVQKRSEDPWNITSPRDLDRKVREDEEVHCLGVYLFRDNEDEPLRVEIFPVHVNAGMIIKFCHKENKGWMKMETVEQPKKIDDKMLGEYLKSPGDFFNALWTKARAKTKFKEDTNPIVRQVEFGNHISGILRSFGYSEKATLHDYHDYMAKPKSIFHKGYVMLKLTDISQSSFEEGIVQGATSSVDLCDVEICWLTNGGVFYTLTKEERASGEQRIKKVNLNEATKEWLASIIDGLHFSDV